MTRPFVLTYWPNWLISQLVLLYTSYFVSQKRQEKRSEMRWLIQNHSWHICQRSLTMTLSLLALNSIVHNQRYRLLPSQWKIWFSKITSTIILYTILDTSARHALKGYRLIQGLHSASSPKGSSTSSVYHYRLSATTTTIYDFNAGSSHPLGKIRLHSRIGSLKSSDVPCH